MALGRKVIKKAIQTCKWCENSFEVYFHRLEDGKGKFCSKRCYDEWQVGRIPKHIPKPRYGENHPGWQGASISYGSLHDWVNHHLGKARVCIFCGKDEGRVEWANIGHTYKRNLNDWLSLCKPCHWRYDHE